MSDIPRQGSGPRLSVLSRTPPPTSPHSLHQMGRKPSVQKQKEASKMLQKLHKEELKQVRSHTDLAQTANGVRMLTKNLAKATIQLHVRAIMIVTKARDNSLTYLTREVVEWLFSRGENITVYVDHK
ncbi:hypothetical protein OXX80_014352, partial [Metschnikowia pulcherrima]